MKYLPKRATSRWFSSASDPTKNAHDKKDEQVLQNTDNTCLSQSAFYVGIDGRTINISLSCTSNACTSGHERNLFANQSLCLATNSAVQLLRIDLGLSQKHECLITTIPDASQGMRCYWATLTLPLGIR